MKKALTGPDIRELVSEWQYLLGCRLEQFGRPSSNELILKFRSSRTGTVRLVVDFSGWAYVTKESIIESLPVNDRLSINPPELCINSIGMDPSSLCNDEIYWLRMGYR